MTQSSPVRITAFLLWLLRASYAFVQGPMLHCPHATNIILRAAAVGDRRSWMETFVAAASTGSCALVTATRAAMPAVAGDFTPAGSLVGNSIGVQVGNSEASASRDAMNGNVLFDKDFYFKFGTAAPYIEKGSVEFPQTMPFTKSQQRYDTLKKYGDRVKSGIANMVALENVPGAEIADPTKSDVYQLRPMGLMANGFLASENTGAPNELFVCRWWINEMYLLIGDMRATDDPASRKKLYATLKKAINSYLTLLNRVISAKVGDKFEYV